MEFGDLASVSIIPITSVIFITRSHKIVRAYPSVVVLSILKKRLSS
jgi:hypothetical protein